MYSDIIKRKENIIITSVEILDEVGLQGLTTKEIAKRQGVSEPAIYKHFTGKLDILNNILDKYSKFDDMIANTVVEQDMDCIQGLFYYASSYAEYFENYPQITTVMLSYDMYAYDSSTKKKMLTIIHHRLDLLKHLLKKGYLKSEIKSTLDIDELANVLHGIIWSLTYMWKLTCSTDSLKKQIIHAFNEILLQK